ncbi:MAG: hypothetical protein AAF497_14210 [Planctomycetota bacterium]
MTIRHFALLISLVAVPAFAEFEVFVTTVGPFGYRNDGIVVFEPDGNVSRFIDQTDFDYQSSIVTDGTFLYAHQEERRLIKYNTAGERLGEIQFQYPFTGNVFTEIASNGDFILAGGGANSSRHDSEGNLITDFGPGRAADGHGDGRTFVADRNELRQYGVHGQLQSTIVTGIFFPGGIAMDESNNLLFLADNPGNIAVFDISGDEPVLDYNIATPSDPLSLWFDDISGDLFITSAGGPFAYRLGVDGDVKQTFFAEEAFFNWGITVVHVPEPGSCGMFIVGLLLMACRIRRSR